MKTYLLTAIGVIFISVVVGLLVPEGKIKKSVNFVLRLICICVLIQPVTKIFIPATSEAPQTEYDYDYVCAVYAQNQSMLVTEKVNEEFGLDCVCRVNIVYDGMQIKEDGVTVEGNFENDVTILQVTEYLKELGYINISVNEKIE